MPVRHRITNMDLRRLKTFVAVAELGTVSKAAVHLRIGQPALSRQIADLQQELGLRLFDRVGRGLVLTAQGEQLLVDCRRVLTDLNRVRERADVLRRGDSGALKVLAPPHTIESVLSGFLPRYAQSFPHVHVDAAILLVLRYPHEDVVQAEVRDLNAADWIVGLQTLDEVARVWVNGELPFAAVDMLPNDGV